MNQRCPYCRDDIFGTPNVQHGVAYCAGECCYEQYIEVRNKASRKERRDFKRELKALGFKRPWHLPEMSHFTRDGQV